FGIERAQLCQIILCFSIDVQSDGRGAFGTHVELPDAEVVLENDHATVRTDRGPANVTGFEARNFVCLAAVFRNAPDIGQAVAVAIADEVNETIVSPHGP